jgi:hypothetical protein
MLDSHSQIAIPFESFVLLDYAKRVKSDYNNLTEVEDKVNFLDSILHGKGIGEWDPKIEATDINIDLCTDYTSTIEQIFSAYAKKCGKNIWGDKTPSYTPNMHLLYQYFPNSKFIHIIRDGRDVAISNRQQVWGQSSLSLIIEDWKQVVSCTRKVGAVLGDKYLELRFEDLITTPKDTLTRVLDFLNLPFENSVLRKEGGAVDHLLPERSQSFHTNLSKPPDTSFVYKWQKELEDTDQVICNIHAGDLLNDLNYPPGCQKTSKTKLRTRQLYHYINQGIKWRIYKLKGIMSH